MTEGVSESVSDGQSELYRSFASKNVIDYVIFSILLNIVLILVYEMHKCLIQIDGNPRFHELNPHSPDLRRDGDQTED